ncbi:MAG TPA: hypothetical protein VF435_08500 [Pyrinomonadaceae bacterium]
MSEARYDTSTNESAEKLLQRAAESLRQESASIQVKMQALTEEEKARVKKIEAAVQLIDQALAELRG